MNRIALGILATALLLCSISACNKGGGNNTDSFDRAALLENTADNIIVPRYASLLAIAEAFDDDVQSFVANPSITGINVLEGRWQAYSSQWQACSTFEFGPAGMVTLRALFNTFPTDTAGINQNMSAGGYNLNTVSNLDKTGLPALNYLINGVGTNDSAILNYYTDATFGASRKQYLVDVSDQLLSLVTTVNNGWTNGYAATFKANTGTDVASSLGMLVNDISQDFETYIRDGKIGIPLGVRSLGTPLPNKTEAYYSGTSLPLAITSIEKLRDLYLGISESGVDGTGLDDYLRYLEAKHGSGLLADKIVAQFTSIETALAAINNPLSEAVVNNPTGVDAAYDEMQKLVVLLKVDLSSALGILITYADNDGD